MKNPFSDPEREIDYGLTGKNVQMKPQKKNSDTSYILLSGKTYPRKMFDQSSYSYPDVLVPVDVSHYGQTWTESQEILHANNEFMLTLRQFADFMQVLDLGMAKDQNGTAIPKKHLTDLLNTVVKSDKGGEWIDGRFDYLRGDSLHMTHHEFTNSNKLVVREDPLGFCMEHTDVSNLDWSWFKKANRQGLPTCPVPNGSMRYCPPSAGRVSRYEYDFGLKCNVDPITRSPAIGVRACKLYKGGKR